MSAMMRLAFKIIVVEFFRIKTEDKVYIQIKSSRTHYQLVNKKSIMVLRCGLTILGSMKFLFFFGIKTGKPWVVVKLCVG
jgi:hypothetical protein